MDIAHIQKANEAELRSFEDRLATEEFQPKVELTFSSGNEWLVIAHYNSEVFAFLVGLNMSLMRCTTPAFSLQRTLDPLHLT